jgi:hypothetical protein
MKIGGGAVNGPKNKMKKKHDVHSDHIYNSFYS